jgi:hypothetical protein
MTAVAVIEMKMARVETLHLDEQCDVFENP